jgi:P27 family predicted phage terminase small subunit
MARRGPKPRKPSPDRGGGVLWHGFEPPADLPGPARAEFDRLRAALAHVGTLDRTDPALVVTAARVGALVGKALDAIEADGLTLTAGNGTPMKHPMLETLNGLTMRQRGLWADMGLTPETARHGVKQADEASNPWTGLLNVFPAGG